MAPIKLSNPTEVQWAKDWLITKAKENDLSLSLDQLMRYFKNGDPDLIAVQKVIKEIAGNKDDKYQYGLRVRLQKALSARRKRALERSTPIPLSQKMKKVPLTTEASEMLLFCAQQRGITNSELIIEMLEHEFEKAKGWIS